MDVINSLQYIDVQAIFRWIESVPNVIWSGVIAAMITLFGVLISNRGNTERLHQQHEHESLQKTKERTVNIRRDLYLTLASDLNRALSHIPQIPNLDPRRTSLSDPVIALSNTSSKCQLVAEQATADLIGDHVGRVNALTMRMIVSAQPIFAATLEFELQEQLRDLTKIEYDAVIAEQKELVKQHDLDVAKLDHLTAYRDELFRRFQKNLQDVLDASTHRTRLVKDYSIEVMRELGPLAVTQVPLIAALRRELEMSTDIDHLMNRIKVGAALAVQSGAEAIDRIHNGADAERD